jgi:protein-S-isoprenylcysteine O-methyltransferase Ste14
MESTTHDTAGVVTYPPLIYVAGLAAGRLLQALAPLKFLPRAWTKPLSGLLTGVALLLAGWAGLSLLRANTAIDPHRPTTAIVTTGPYKYTRNPIYLSFTLGYTGLAARANSLWTMLLLPVVLLVLRRGVIEREERYLARKFGDEYLRYTGHVRRWL